MSRFGHPVGLLEPPLGAVLVGRFALAHGHQYDTHTHPTHQLVWAQSGILTVGVDDALWVLPPSRALFIPAELPHTTTAATSTELHSLFLRPQRCPVRWARPTVLAAAPVFTALVGYLGKAELPPEARCRAEEVLFDVLTPAPAASVEVAWPSDDRARRVADALATSPADDRDAAAWARLVDTSERTLARLFVAETGSGLGQWRTRMRIRSALELLASGTPVAIVAHRVGYRTASAFVAAFRRVLGVTPAQCFSQGSGLAAEWVV
ncbi:MAG: helix-turn-helix transcriptional regulator [Actinomycetota bacterium]|nr:helix-turn-helix transcriptional regulator [Actinomycetota bacterium]